MDFPPSEEQQMIINGISNSNINVNAVAGSGKTSTLIFISQQNKDKKILQVTYNKQLKLEVREKIRKNNIENVEIHTYHSLCVKYYYPQCFTDDEIIKILENNMEIKSDIEYNYDIIAIDEVQDMTPNYFELIYKFLKDIKFNGNILILGDNKQGIYEFKNADTRFLTLSSKIWGNKNNFENLELSQSFRVTKQIAWFVNNVMLGDNRIVSNKNSNHKIYYYKKSIYNIHFELFKKIKYYLSNGYKAEDIFVLAPTLKKENNPVKKLENIMVKSNIPVYFSRNEEDGIDEKIIAGKAVFTTYHQSKGRERKIVFVYGFDDSYFDYFAQDKNRFVCPAELYVAITRSSEILHIIEHDVNESLSFLKIQPENFYKHLQYIDYTKEIPKKNNKKEENKEVKYVSKIHSTTVIDLTAYLGEIIMREISSLLNKIIITENFPDKKNTVEIPSVIKTKNGLTEDVSDLNSIVISSIFEAHVGDGKSKIQKVVENICQNETKENKSFIEKKKNELKKHQNNAISVYLILGNLYIALTENILSKLNQIDKYDWLEEDVVKVCHKNIKKNIEKDSEYQVNIIMHNGCEYIYDHKEYGKISIKGKYHAINSKCLWCIKCCGNISNEHILQLVIYSWLHNKINNEAYLEMKYKIINMRTGEIKVLNYDVEKVDQIIELLFKNKYQDKKKDSDVIFLRKCKIVREKYD